MPGRSELVHASPLTTRVSAIRSKLLLGSVLIALFAIGGCVLGGEDATQVSPEDSDAVWTLAFDREFAPPIISSFFIVEPGQSAEIELAYRVASAACRVEPETNVVNFCNDRIERLQGQNDPSTLTATGRLVISLSRIDPFEIGTQHIQIESVSMDIPAHRFGEFVVMQPVVFDLPHLGRDRPTTDGFDYQISVRTFDCRLSNGSFCSNFERLIEKNIYLPGESIFENPPDTGSSSQGLTATGTAGATATSTAPSVSQKAGVNSVGRITGLAPNANGVVIDSSGSTIQLSTDSSGAISGTFTFEWRFQSSPNTKFVTSGTLTGARTRNLVSGQFQLDDPGINFLALQLADDAGVGKWGGTVLADRETGAWVDGGLSTVDGGVVNFELGVE